MRKRGFLTVVLMAVAAMFILSGCEQASVNPSSGETSQPTSTPAASPASGEKQNNEEVSNVENPKVQIEMENGGKIVLELYPEYAPKTVENFVKLASEGFYNGLTFHRIVDGFMAQGGDPQGTGTGGSADKITGEFSKNGFAQNTLKHTKGVISMARSGDPNSASSQFFIMLGDISSLDGSYAAFGKVVEGMDVVEKFQTVERTVNAMGETATPVKPVVMKKVTVLK